MLTFILTSHPGSAEAVVTTTRQRTTCSIFSRKYQAQICKKWGHFLGSENDPEKWPHFLILYWNHTGYAQYGSKVRVKKWTQKWDYIFTQNNIFSTLKLAKKLRYASSVHVPLACYRHGYWVYGSRNAILRNFITNFLARWEDSAHCRPGGWSRCWN